LQPRHDIKTGANLNSFTYQGLLNNFLWQQIISGVSETLFLSAQSLKTGFNLLLCCYVFMRERQLASWRDVLREDEQLLTLPNSDNNKQIAFSDIRYF
jgi:hypothetical protein